MNLRQVALALCLVPIISFGNDGTSRREELEKLQFEKLSEIACLSKKIHEEHEPYFIYQNIALNYWHPTNEEEKETFLERFIEKLSKAFDKSIDINKMIDEAPFVKKDSSDIKLIVTRAVLQNLLIEKIITQYKNLLQELIVITKELNNLKG